MGQVVIIELLFIGNVLIQIFMNAKYFLMGKNHLPSEFKNALAISIPGNPRYTKKMLGCLNPNLGQIWTNPNLGLKNAIKKYTGES